ncbi:hypothetical protein V8F20_008110 [Naviculisporaceae sp. PSN 640]
MIRLATFIMTALAVVVSGLQAPIPGYTVTEVVWEVNPWNNGTLLNITGPVEHVVEVLEEINPDLIKNFTHSDPGAPNNAELSDIKCGALSWGWQRALHERIYEGAEYLKTVQGRPVQGPGPGSCGRVSCSYQAAIWWCNDNKVTKTLPGFATIGDCAKELCNACTEKDDDYYCRGQSFQPGNWNCIVRYDNDRC